MTFGRERIKTWLGRRDFSTWWSQMSEYLTGGGLPPIPLSRENPGLLNNLLPFSPSASLRIWNLFPNSKTALTKDEENTCIPRKSIEINQMLQKEWKHDWLGWLEVNLSDEKNTLLPSRLLWVRGLSGSLSSSNLSLRPARTSAWAIHIRVIFRWQGLWWLAFLESRVYSILLPPSREKLSTPGIVLLLILNLFMSCSTFWYSSNAL